MRTYWCFKIFVVIIFSLQQRREVSLSLFFCQGLWKGNTGSKISCLLRGFWTLIVDIEMSFNRYLTLSGISKKCFFIGSSAVSDIELCLSRMVSCLRLDSFRLFFSNMDCKWLVLFRLSLKSAGVIDVVTWPFVLPGRKGVAGYLRNFLASRVPVASRIYNAKWDP